MAVTISTIPSGGSAASSTDNSLLETSPAIANVSAGVLLVALVAVTGQITGTFVANWSGGNSLTFTLVATALKNSSGDSVLMFVSDTLAPSGMNSVAFKFTPAGSPTNTGAILTVHSATGMARTGLAAIRQTAKTENQGGGTPSVTFPAAVLTGNATIGALGKGDTAGVSPLGSWTEGFYLNYSSPNTSLKTVYRNSGFTGTIVQWTSASNFCALMAELDISAPTVTSVSANSGSTAGGTNVTITGTGFFGAATVTFGGSSATNVVVVSNTSITCTTPAHAAGAVNVVVTNPDTQTGTGTNAYTYVAAPTSKPGTAMAAASLGLHL